MVTTTDWTDVVMFFGCLILIFGEDLLALAGMVLALFLERGRK
jgi:hypothetical protein